MLSAASSGAAKSAAVILASVLSPGGLLVPAGGLLPPGPEGDADPDFPVMIRNAHTFEAGIFTVDR